jgi:hypothetical protein
MGQNCLLRHDLRHVLFRLAIRTRFGAPIQWLLFVAVIASFLGSMDSFSICPPDSNLTAALQICNRLHNLR